MPAVGWSVRGSWVHQAVSSVMVPAGVEELDESHVPFDEAASQDAVGRECPGPADFRAVQREGLVGLAGEVGQLGDGRCIR